MKEAFLTKNGVQELRARLTELKTVRRREVAEAIHSAKEQGDLTENAEYVSAKDEQRRLEEEIAELEVTLKHARIITKSDTNTIALGNTVTLDCDGARRTYTIVGSKEADPIHGMISNESPMGQSLMGHRRGERVIIPTPVGDKHCTVIAIT